MQKRRRTALVRRPPPPPDNRRVYFFFGRYFFCHFLSCSLTDCCPCYSARGWFTPHTVRADANTKTQKENARTHTHSLTHTMHFYFFGMCPPHSATNACYHGFVACSPIYIFYMHSSFCTAASAPRLFPLPTSTPPTPAWVFLGLRGARRLLFPLTPPPPLRLYLFVLSRPPTHVFYRTERRVRRRRHPNTVIPLNFLPPPPLIRPV